MQKVFTYFEPIDEVEDSSGQQAMIEHWSASWAKAGWYPIVLGLADAEMHPMFDEYIESVKRLPTVNPAAYELTCYKRWMAVACQGGGFMSDYDVVNYGFTARDPQSDLCLYEQGNTGAVVPSVVGGTAAGFLNACLCFATCKIEDVTYEHNSGTHTSDMVVMQKMAHRLIYSVAPHVKQYGCEDWDKAELVHYSHETTSKTNRIECMRTARGI